MLQVMSPLAQVTLQQYSLFNIVIMWNADHHSRGRRRVQYCGTHWRCLNLGLSKVQFSANGCPAICPTVSMLTRCFIVSYLTRGRVSVQESESMNEETASETGSVIEREVDSSRQGTLHAL